MNSRHDDCFQLMWKAGDRTLTLNLSREQVQDYLFNDITLKHLVMDFVENGMRAYELLQEESQPQTKEGEGELQQGADES